MSRSIDFLFQSLGDSTFKGRHLGRSSRSRLRKDKKIGLNSYTWDSYNMDNRQVFLAATDAEDVIVSEFLLEKAYAGIDTQFKSLHLLCSMEDWKSFVANNTEGRTRIFQSGEEHGAIFFNEAIIKFNISSTYISVKLIGENNFIKNFEQTLKDTKLIFTEVGLQAYYEGQSLKPQIDEFLGSLGFTEITEAFELNGFEYEGNTVYKRT